MSSATISQVRIAAAHDGEAELIVTLKHENGGESLVALDEFAAQTLMTNCAANTGDELIGTGWEQVRDALVASSDRYSGNQKQEHSGGLGNA
ncbi:MAG: hypothetical protein RLO80_05865 [Hyphomonas sp.]